MSGPGLESGGGSDVHDAAAAAGTMAGRNRRVSAVRAVMLRSIWPRISSSGICANSPKTPKPALLMRMSMAMPSRWSWSKRNFGAGGVGEIESDGLYRDALRLQFVGDLRQFVGAAGNQHQIVMIAGEELGEFVSDAAGGAGDERR